MIEPQMMVIVIINWILGLLGLVFSLFLFICPLGALIAALVEGSKQLVPGERRSWKVTKIFGIGFGVSLVGVIVIFVLYGVAAYFLSNSLGPVAV
ncbi:MAG: hypothetical protein ACD_41C00133G0007 [uncultured bacterium]|nr:MAG: hypothetical protein ACD_41C00133G0007 [uncultured bacterium]